MCSSEWRYDAISTASSPERACSEPLSSGATTATVPRPSSRAARNTRSAISPRFATSTFRTRGTLDRCLAVDQQAVDRAEEAARATGDMGKDRQMIALLRRRLPKAVDHLVWRPADIL